MRLKIAPSDRKLLLWSATILFPVVTALAILSGVDEEDSGIPSTYSAQSQGAKAAWLLLNDLHYRVERWDSPPGELPPDAMNVVLILANPGPASVDKDDKLALNTFLSRGGRILVTGCAVRSFVPQAAVEAEDAADPSWKHYSPELPTRLTRAGDISMSPSCYWEHSAPPLVTHYSDNGRPVVVSYKVGAGEVIWWASATPLTNAGIREAGNLGLFLNALGERKNARILWDEYYHGARASLRGYFAEWPILFGLLQCGLLFAAVVFTYSRRNLPIHSAPEPSRLSPLEFVETLGSLYRRARAKDVALEVPYQRFRSAAIRRLGLRPETSNSNLVKALRERTGYKDASLENLLSRIESALYSAPSEKATLEMVQELNGHMHNLKLLPEETITHGNRVPGAEPRTN